MLGQEREGGEMTGKRQRVGDCCCWEAVGRLDKKSMLEQRLHQYPVNCGWTTPRGSPGSKSATEWDVVATKTAPRGSNTIS